MYTTIRPTVLPLRFLHYNHGSAALIFRALYPWLLEILALTQLKLRLQETTWFKPTLVLLVIDSGRKMREMKNSTVIHTSTSMFDISFPNLYLHLLASFLIKFYVSYKKM